MRLALPKQYLGNDHGPELVPTPSTLGGPKMWIVVILEGMLREERQFSCEATARMEVAFVKRDRPYAQVYCHPK